MEKKNKTRLIAGTIPNAGSTAVPKFWNIVEVGDDEAEITMYGDVCSSQPVDWWTGEPLPGLFISPEGFLEDLAQIKDKAKITIKLNSCGGDLYTGIAIHNALKGLAGHKTVVVEGIAASAASVIMCAGDEVQVYPGSMVMIHGVAGLFFDFMDISDLKQAMKSFDAAEKAIAEIYGVKTGTETETLRSMMKKETWMVGQEAVDEGFADTLLDGAGPSMVMSADKKVLLVAGVQHNVEAFRNMPGGIPITNRIQAAVKAVEDNNKKPTAKKNSSRLSAAYAGGRQERGKKMGKQMLNKQTRKKNAEPDVQELEKNVDELEKEVADLEDEVADLEDEVKDLEKEVKDLERENEDLQDEIDDLKEQLDEANQAQNSILKAERQRLREIDNIAAAVGDNKILRDAKYDNPCSAEELALRSMKANSKLGATYLANSKSDYDASRAGKVGAAPNSGEDDGYDDTEIDTVVNTYKKSKNGGKQK